MDIELAKSKIREYQDTQEQMYLDIERDGENDPAIDDKLLALSYEIDMALDLPFEFSGYSDWETALELGDMDLSTEEGWALWINSMIGERSFDWDEWNQMRGEDRVEKYTDREWKWLVFCLIGA